MQGQFRNELLNSDNSKIDNLIASTHLLKKVNQSVDFSFVNELTASCYSPNNGRPSISPKLCFRMLLIGYLFSIPSNRRLIEEVKYNVSYRWFCGLALDSPVPSHSSLSRFFKRLSFRVFQSFFNAIIKQCHQAGLLNNKSVMTDSTLFQANASLNSLVPRTGDEQDTHQGERGVRPTTRTVSNKTHQSKTDPDASLAFKKGAPRTLKYKAHVCTTSQSRVILDIKITTGAVHDSQTYLEQLDTIKLSLNHDMNEVIADRAYGSGHIIATLKSMGITTYIPLFNTRSGTAQRTITPGFHYEADSDTYRCPANHELNPGKRLDNDYVLYHSRVKHCRDCSIKTSCQAPKKKNKDIRVIARHTHFDLFQQVTLAMQSALFKQKLVERLAQIESVMNELKNYHCLAKARYRGIHNVQMQAYMAAIAINIKRLVFLFFINLLMLFKCKLPFATGRTVCETSLVFIYGTEPTINAMVTKIRP